MSTKPIDTYLIDHLFLPPRIVTDKVVECGINTPESELELLTFVYNAISEYRESGLLASPEAINEIDSIVRMLGVMVKLQILPVGSDDLKSSLMETFANMEESGTYCFSFIFFIPTFRPYQYPNSGWFVEIALPLNCHC